MIKYKMVSVTTAVIAITLQDYILKYGSVVKMPIKKFNKTKNSWLDHSSHILANNFLPANIGVIYL